MKASGVHGLKMDDVARKAELSKGTLYLYFSGRDALLAGVALRTMASIGPMLEEAAQSENGLERLLTIQRLIRAHLRSLPHAFRLMVEWMLELDIDDQSPEFQAYRERIASVRGAIIDAIEQGKEDGSIRTDLPALPHGMHFWATTVGVALFERSPTAMAKRIGHPVDLEALERLHEDVFRRAFAPSPQDDR